MNRKKQFFNIIAALLVMIFMAASTFAITDSSAKIRSWDMKVVKDQIQLAIHADKPVQYKAIHVGNPEQALVLDVYSAVLWGKKETRPVNQGAVQDVRIAQFSSSPDVVRVVLDLKHPVNFTTNLADNQQELDVAVATAADHPVVTVQPEKNVSSAPTQPQDWKHVKIEKKVVGIGSGLIFMPRLAPLPAGKSVSSRELASQQEVAARTRSKKKVMWKKRMVPASSQFVTIHWRNADLTDVVRQLADRMNLNVIVDTAVKGTVTTDLKHVSAAQALGMILAINGYGYNQVGNILVVATPDKLAVLPKATAAMGPEAVQVIPLEYAKAGDLSSTIASEYQAVKVNAGPGNELIVKGPVSEIKKARELVSELDKSLPPPIPPQKAIIQLSYAQAKDVAAQLKPLLPADAILIVDDRLQQIVVVGSPYDIDTVKSFASTVDVPSPQVMLAMQVISVNVDNTSDLGVLWPGGATTTFYETPNGKLPTEGGSPPPADTGSGGGSVLNNLGFHTFIRDNLQFIVSLKTLVSLGKAKVLGAPRVATLNDKQASIQLGQRVPVVYFDPRAGMYQVQYIDVGVVLNITPHISPDGYITVHVSPQVSEVTNYVQQYPQLETRQADTNVRVKNGETIVLGGLLNESTNETITKIPLLGDIPIIGQLFKRTQRSHSKTDLVVSITPTVLSDKY